MANNTIGWGQGATNNDIGWGRGSTNDIGWGSIYENSYVGDTDIIGGVSYLLDTYAGAAAAYSLRQLKSGITNVVRVRADVVGQPEQDFTAAQITDGTLATFVGVGNNGYVVTWYDQSGLGNHATQGTASNQPQIVASGVVITENGMPAVQFDGTTTYLGNTSLLGLLEGTDYTLVSALNSFNAAGIYFVNGTLLYGRYFGYISGYMATLSNSSGYNNVSSYNNTNLLNTQSLVFNVAKSSATDIDVFANNTSETGTSVTSVPIGPNGTYIGFKNRTADTQYFDGNIQELIFYPIDQSSNRTNIEGNINGYYSIY